LFFFLTKNKKQKTEKLRDIVNNKMPKAHICPTFMNFSFAQVQEVEANDEVMEDRIPLGVDNDEDIDMGGGGGIEGGRSDDEQEMERRLEQEIGDGDNALILDESKNVVQQQQQQQPGSAK